MKVYKKVLKYIVLLRALLLRVPDCTSVPICMFGYFSAKCNMFLTYLMDKTSFASQILEANQFVLQRASRRVPDCILTFWTPLGPSPPPFSVQNIPVSSSLTFGDNQLPKQCLGTGLQIRRPIIRTCRLIILSLHWMHYWSTDP